MDEKTFLESEFERIRNLKDTIITKINAQAPPPDHKGITVQDKIEWNQYFSPFVTEIAEKYNAVSKDVKETLSKEKIGEKDKTRISNKIDNYCVKLFKEFWRENM